MSTEGEIINRVANSKLVVLDIDELLPRQSIIQLDILQFSEGGLLREKAFREAIDQHDWTQYAGKMVNVFCGDDAIVPLWAFMIVGARLGEHTQWVISTQPEQAEKEALNLRIAKLDFQNLQDKPVVLKGCNRPDVGPDAYVILAQRIRNFAGSLLFGEACSSVPVYKKSKAIKRS
jgi:hypothetical protein